MTGFGVAGFRPAALLFLLVPIPLLALWLLEGGLLLSFQGFGDRGEVAMVAAHRIAGWWVVFVAGAVFAYGITRTEPDVRLTAMGEVDPRRLWAARWLPVAMVFVLVAAVVAALLAAWSGESLLRLVGATAAATLFSLTTGYTVAVLSGASPAMVSFTTVVLIAAAALLPPQLGVPEAFSLAPGPLGWLRGDPYGLPFLWHDLAVVGLSASVAVFGMLVPRDVRDVRWIARYGGNDA